ncbi:MAG: hypothetical protein GQ534_08800, partial [Candidatus Delongbacteria bacterium]|nr:hypothetical protein [Candidatus Delongbacteria bacterium]
MKRLLKKIFIFSILIAVIFSFLFYYFYRIGGDDLPAPYFSNSISFNEKIQFIKENNKFNSEILILGSSMALNNLASKVIIEDLKTNKLLNAASWGVRVSDSENFIKNISGYFGNLEYVILVANLMDFSKMQNKVIIDYDGVKYYFDHNLGNLSYLKYFNLNYFIKNSKLNKERNRAKNTYQSLVFDQGGSVILDIDSNEIDMSRWNKKIDEFEVLNSEIQSLNSIAEYLKTRQIKFIVAISPVKKSSLSLQQRSYVTKEICNIKDSIDESVIFIDSYNLSDWYDSYYVDFAHFNKLGAKRFTSYIVNTLKMGINRKNHKDIYE